MSRDRVKDLLASPEAMADFKSYNESPWWKTQEGIECLNQLKKVVEKTMNFEEYQEKAVSTAIYPEQYKIMYPAMGLAGEVGEVLNKIKKVYRDNDGVFSDEKKQDLLKELGDCQWYLASLAKDLGGNLQDVARDNIDKLQSRKERGVISGSGDNR